MKLQKKLIESRLSNLKIDLEAENKFGEKVKDVFCDVWPTTEKGINYVMLAVKNPIARWLLGLALVICISVAEKNCRTVQQNGVK